MSKKSRSLMMLPSDKILFIFYGICIIITFFIIYLIVAINLGRPDYFSLFFNNIKNHPLLTILTFMHVGFFGLGVLTIIFAFFNITPKITMYEDRFEIKLFLQKIKIVKFSEIKNVEVKFFQSSNENKFLNRFKKECRMFINNPVYNFYIAYPISGYYDNMEIMLKTDRETLLRRCITKRKNVEFILDKLNRDYGFQRQFLPEENV